MLTKRTIPPLVSVLLSTVILILPSVAASATPYDNTSTSFVLDNLRYDLVDLDPNDGITPSLTFTIDPTSRNSHARVRARNRFGDAVRDYGPWLPPAAPSSVSLDLFPWNASASMTGTLGTDLSLQGDATISGADGIERTLSTWADSGYITFVLSPMSAVTWHTDIEGHGIAAAVTAPTAGGMVSLELSLSLFSESPAQSERSSYRFTAAPGDRFDLNDTIEATLSNTLATGIQGGVNLNGSGYLSNSVSPVPEPAHWALLLTGLAVITGARRRARRR